MTKLKKFMPSVKQVRIIGVVFVLSIIGFRCYRDSLAHHQLQQAEQIIGAFLVRGLNDVSLAGIDLAGNRRMIELKASKALSDDEVANLADHFEHRACVLMGGGEFVNLDGLHVNLRAHNEWKILLSDSYSVADCPLSRL